MSDGGILSSDINLCIIGAIVKIETMAENDLTKGEHVDNQYKGAQNWSLEDTLSDGRCGGFVIAFDDEMLSVSEVGCEPGKSSISETNDGV